MMNFGREFTARIKREPWIMEFDKKIITFSWFGQTP
jgi:hypothetical protein